MVTLCEVCRQSFAALGKQNNDEPHDHPHGSPVYILRV